MTPDFSSEAFVAVLALVGLVIVVAALFSGLIERSGLPQVAIFLGLGAVVGPAGLGLLEINLTSPVLHVVATLCLVMVLFTDAVTIDITEMRRHATLALIVLGPGTIVTAALIGLAAWGLLGLSVPVAAILGAALASTDPILLRGILRSRFVPNAARQVLRLESGLNDIVLLPIVLVAMAFLEPGPGGASGNTSTEWARLAIELVLLGPGAGVAVGVVAVAALDLIRRRIGVLRDYESLYALGTAFAAYAAAESVHGSGFLAAFAAGLTISALDVELCDCFLEYGQTTAEMTLLFAFVLLGSSLIWSAFTVIGPMALLFVAVAIMVRPAVYLASLARTALGRRDRLLIAWFGPRGLSSLLLVLLPVFAGRQGSEYPFALCSLVVLVSLVLHGGTPLFIPGPPKRVDDDDQETANEPIPANVEPTLLPMLNFRDQARPPRAREDARDLIDGGRISVDDLRQLWASGQPVVILDTRSERTYKQDLHQAAGAIRLQPDHVVDRARELRIPRASWIVTYCT